jgi:hypothetical protein
MSPHGHDVEPEITLPAGMEIVVPPRAPEEIEEQRSSGSAPARSVERAAFPPFVHRGETRRAPGA